MVSGAVAGRLSLTDRQGQRGGPYGLHGGDSKDRRARLGLAVLMMPAVFSRGCTASSICLGDAMRWVPDRWTIIMELALLNTGVG